MMGNLDNPNPAPETVQFARPNRPQITGFVERFFSDIHTKMVDHWAQEKKTGRVTSAPKDDDEPNQTDDDDRGL